MFDESEPQKNSMSPADKSAELEKKISSLDEFLKRSGDIIQQMSTIIEEHKEVALLLKGLIEKVEILNTENKKRNEVLPETDEEWVALLARTEKIQKIYLSIESLQDETDIILEKLENLQVEFDLLPKFKF